MALNKTKKILLITAIPVAIAGWALFRPELALINKTVNESAPSAATSKVLAAGQFESFAHETVGNAQFINDGGKTILRLTNFKTSNGPDVRVLLVRGDNAQKFGDDYLDLGEIKGNHGDQNYVLPAGTEISSYQAVSIWCKRFNVSFGGAKLKSEKVQASLPTVASTRLAAFGEIKVTGGKFSGAAGRADMIENDGKRLLRLSGVKVKGLELYLLKKETYSKSVDISKVTKEFLGATKSAATQQFSVSKDLDLWLYRSVVLVDPKTKTVKASAALRSDQEQKSGSSLSLAI
ncbi:MAG: DM13 domain-containing protein [Chthonomonas sp.]|nr:DM13 domain-containing protein [Chthonomonas sp.]